MHSLKTHLSRAIAVKMQSSSASKSKFKKDDVWLPELLTNGVLDHVHQLSDSCLSPDQPGNGSCVHVALLTWTTDLRARKLISHFCALFKSNELPVLHNSRALLTRSLYNCAHASKEGQEHTFRQLMSKIHEESKGDEEKTYDNKFSGLEVLV